MPVITSVRLKKRTGDCFVRLQEDEEPLLISSDLVLKYRIGKSSVLSDAEFDAVMAEQQLIGAKQAAYNFCAYKPRTEHRLRMKLKEKKFSQACIDSAVEFVISFGLIDDARFAAGHMQRVLARRPAGKTKVMTDLLGLGIRKEIAREAIERYYPQEEEYSSLLKAAEKKMAALQAKSPEKQKAALYAYLIRKGFAHGMVREITARFVEES